MISITNLMSKIDPDFSPQMLTVDYKGFDVLYPDLDQDVRIDKPVHGIDIANNPKWLDSVYDVHWSGAVLRKVSDLETEIDPREEGIKGFYESERHNAETNRKLSVVFEGLVDLPEELAILLVRMKLIIANIVGDISPSDIGTRFTSGATVDLPSGRNIVESISPLASCTNSLDSYLRLYGFGLPSVNRLYSYVASERCIYDTPINRNPWVTVATQLSDNLYGSDAWSRSNNGFVDYCDTPTYNISNEASFFFINKYWNKGRNGFTSPTVNMAVGSHYSDILQDRLLKSTGIDITTATQLHWHLARVGSITLDYATIDKEGGSDHIAYQLINLFPASHRGILDALRVKEYSIDGEKGKFEMLGHQGATYTFIIETILFFAIAVAVGYSVEDVRVFGDDTIIKTRPDDPRLEVYFKLANFLGVKVNKEKSLYGFYLARESCGGDFINGVSVRPYYFKKVNLTTPADVHTALNGIYDRYYDPVHRQWLDSRFKALWSLLYRSMSQLKGYDNGQESNCAVCISNAELPQSNNIHLSNNDFNHYELCTSQCKGKRFIGPYGSGDQAIAYADEKYWSYTSTKRDKIYALRHKTDGDRTSLYLSLSPNSIHGKKQVLYNMFHDNIALAVLHGSTRGMSNGHLYTDFIRVDVSRSVYTESSIKLVGIYDDEPMDALSNIKRFQSGSFIPIFDFLDGKVKERSAHRLIKEMDTRNKAYKNLISLLTIRKDQLNIVIDW